MTATATIPTRTEWQDELMPLIAQASKIDPMQAEHHPAYRGLLERIDRLIETGLEYGFITPEEAAQA